MIAKIQDIKFLCIDKTKRINTMMTYLKSILCIAIAAFISSTLHAQNESSKKSMPLLTVVHWKTERPTSPALMARLSVVPLPVVTLQKEGLT